MLKNMDEQTLLNVFKGVPQSEISKKNLKQGLVFRFPVSKGRCVKSNGEARRMLKDNAVSINKAKITESYVINSESLLNNKYVLVTKGQSKNLFFG